MSELAQQCSRMTLADLRKAWGRIEITEGTPELPYRIVRTSMADRQVWVRVGGSGSKALFELQRDG